LTHGQVYGNSRSGTEQFIATGILSLKLKRVRFTRKKRKREKREVEVIWRRSSARESGVGGGDEMRNRMLILHKKG